MYTFPKDPPQIKARIRRYESALKKEQKQFGTIDDSAGKRYLLGPLYLLAGDIKGALAHYRWFSKTCPDDSDEPIHSLCWTLALYLSGDEKAAQTQLRQTMLMNLYLMPRLLGENPKPPENPFWNSSTAKSLSCLRSALLTTV